MSNFEGEYFRYDVGLVDESLDEPSTVKNPTNVTSQLLSVNTITGTLSSFEVLEVYVRGQGVSDGKFVVATSDDDKDGAYIIRVRMTYQTVDGNEVEKIHTLNIPISGDVKINLEKKLNTTRGGPLPAVDAVVLNPTGDASKFSISIAVSEVGNVDYINGIEIEDNVLRFKQGLESVGSGGSIVVNLNYTSLTGDPMDGRILSFVYAPVAGDGLQVDQIKSAEVASIKMYGQKATNDDKKIFKLPHDIAYEESNDKMAVVIYGSFEFTANGYTHTGDKIRLVRSTSLSADEVFEVKEVSENEFKLVVNPSHITLNDGQTYRSVIYDSNERMEYRINPSGYLNYENLLANYSFKLSSEKDTSGNGYWTAEVSLKNIIISSEGETNVKASFGFYDPKGPSSPFRIIYTPATSGSKIKLLEEAKFKEVQLEGVVVNDKIEVSNFNLICSSYKYINGDNNEISVNTESTLKIVIDNTDDANKLDIVGDNYAFTFSFDDDKYIEINDNEVNLFVEGSKLFIPLGAKLSFRKFAEGKYRLNADETKVYGNLGEMTQPQMKWSAAGVSTGNWFGIAYGDGKFVVVGDSGMYATSSDGTNWSAVSAISGQSGAWRGITYGDGKFVVVGGYGMYTTSSDGTNWTNATTISGQTNSWLGIAYGDGKFVAVGDSGMYATSSDGTNWSAVSAISGQSGAWWSVAYGDGKFVVVGANGKYATSSDGGGSWTTNTIYGQPGAWYGVAYGNNKFVVVGANGEYTTSSDGTTWTTASSISGQTSYWYGVAYGNNKFVVVGEVGKYATSSDGTNWLNATAISGQSSSWRGIAYGNNKFVAVGSNGKYTILEDWVATWTNATAISGQTGAWYDITYGNGKFVAVGDSGKYATSSDGTNWTNATTISGQTNSWLGIAYGDGKFVVVGDGGKYATSSDGVNWTNTSTISGQTGTWLGVAYGNNKFVVVGEDGKYVTSSDGTTWSTASSISGQTGAWTDIAYGNNKFVTVGSSGMYSTSSDGTTWSTASTISGQSNYWRGVAYGDGKFVAVGANGKYSTSSDGTTWSTASTISGQSSSWRGIAYGNGKFVAVGEASKYAISSDGGGSWSTASSISGQTSGWYGTAYGNNKFVAVGANAKFSTSDIPTSASYVGAIPGQTGGWYGTAYGDGKFVVVGDGSRYAISSDGVNWTNTSTISGQTGTWNGIAYGNGKFVVVGGIGKYATSSNGTTWSAASTISGQTNSWLGIAYGDGKFVTVGSSGMYSTSSDGTTWSTASTISGQTGAWRGIAYGDGKFVVVGNSSRYAISSDGGVSWSTGSISEQSGTWYGVAYGDGKFVAVGYGKYAISSDGGVSWSTGSISGQTGSWNGVAYENNKFVAVGNSGKYSTSSDGTTWSTASTISGQPGYWEDITCRTYNGNYEWIACGDYGLTIRLLDIPAKPLNPTVPLYFKGLNYNQSMRFEALDKSTTASLNPAFTVYENLLTSGSLLDFTSDAGFVIPVIENGKYTNKYVRISDLYNEIANYERSGFEQPPALEDRLHACEVALDSECSSTLVNGSGEAARLYNIKNKWCVVDIQGLA